MNSVSKSRVLIIVVATCSITGCYSLPNFLSSDDSNKELAGKNQFQNLGLSSSLKAKVDKSEKEASMQNLVKEWAEIRPAIMRVVALEEDMQFLMESMSEVYGAGPVYSAQNFVETQNSIQASFEEAPAIKYQEMVSSPSRVTRDTKGVNEQKNSGGQRSPSKLKVNAAPMIMSNLDSLRTETITANQEGVDDAKFSSVSKVSMVQDNSVTPGQQVQAPRLANLSDCNANYAQEIGKGSAVHLVSYKSKQFLVSGSQVLSQKYADVLCGKMPIFKEVMVNGNMFYSMRFGPFFNRDKALEACSSIKKAGQYCGVTKFDGEQVL